MNQLTKPLLYWILLVVTHSSYVSSSLLHIQEDYTATYLSRLSRENRVLLVYGYTKKITHIPDPLSQLIQYFLYGNTLQYRNKKLPEDLSGLILRGFDFTGCKFTETKLHGSILEDLILDNTICDYRFIGRKNIPEANVLKGDYLFSYRDELPTALATIYHVYPTLENHQKAILLEIASGLAWLPFSREKVFFCRYAYYASKLLDLKIKGGSKCEELDFPQSGLYGYINKSCWSTQYKQSDDHVAEVLIHSDFNKYLKEFKEGFIKYDCKSEYPQECDKYKKTVITNINMLQKLYPLIKHRKEIANKVLVITQKLASSYQYGGIRLFGHLNFCKEHLIELKNELGGINNGKCICL